MVYHFTDNEECFWFDYKSINDKVTHISIKSLVAGGSCGRDGDGMCDFGLTCRKSDGEAYKMGLTDLDGFQCRSKLRGDESCVEELHDDCSDNLTCRTSAGILCNSTSSATSEDCKCRTKLSIGVQCDGDLRHHCKGTLTCRQETGTGEECGPSDSGCKCARLQECKDTCSNCTDGYGEKERWSLGCVFWDQRQCCKAIFQY